MAVIVKTVDESIISRVPMCRVGLSKIERSTSRSKHTEVNLTDNGKSESDASIYR